MRIVLLYLGRKGAGPVYSLEFAKALLEQEVELYVIISSFAANLCDWEELENSYASTGLLTINRVQTFRSKVQFVKKTINPFVFLKMRKKVINFHPDIVLSTMIHPWHNIIFRLLKKKVVRIKIIHDTKPHIGENSIFYKLLNYCDIHTADKWVTLTKKAKNDLLSLGLPNDGICVIPHAHFGYYSKSLLFTEANSNLNYRIAFFGRICKYKGVDLLIKSFYDVIEVLPNLKLRIAGHGEFTEDMMNMIRKNNNIELINRWIEDDEIAGLLKDVDIVVLPYIEASQSGVIPLAFSLKKPVIATNVGGLPEQVPIECGLIIPSNDIDVLSSSIIDLYKHPLLIKQMGEAGYKYARKSLNWTLSAKSLLAFIKSK